jgi:hypothetical protein
MTPRKAHALAACVALLALWSESALLAWWFDPTTSAIGDAAACIGGTLAAVAVMIPSRRHRPSSWTVTEWAGLFVGGLVLSLVFAEIDCNGSLALVGGHPTCSRYHGNITQVFTLAVMALTATAIPGALHAWLRVRLARGPA